MQNIPVVKTHIQSCKESLFKLQESEQERNQEATASSSVVEGSNVVNAMVKVESWEREIEMILKKVKTLSQKVQVAALWNS